ncbi:LOW QUALITY PROTEIN: hypothetical protein Cgig2_021444 [Carnegiea gigantea]|uniref:Uncharacterized protein n=1 Tax=Carnegiea gigantea TaxID=171969 RepID=A0A9Q1QA10_9CARY|nr:LOW QUALITY PROTEIN: hypothetical protein Cgig2_021444 [Carnegiea gigantea]
MRPENSLVLGESLAGIHPPLTNLRRLSWMTASYQELTLLISIRLSFVSYRCEDNLIMEHYYPDRLSRQFGFHQDVPADLDFYNCLDPKIMLCCHHVLTCCGTGSQRNTTRAFVNGDPRCSFRRLVVHMLVTPRGNEDEGKLGSKPLIEDCLFWEALRTFCSTDGGWFFSCQDSRNRCCHPTTTYPCNPYLKHYVDKLLIGVCEPIIEKVIEFPPEGAKNIMDILDAEPNPTECMGEGDDLDIKEELAYVLLRNLFDSGSRLDGLKSVCSPNNGEIESIHRAHAPSVVPHLRRPLRSPQGRISIFNVDALIKEVDKNGARVFGKAILDKMSHTPFDGLPSLKGNFDSL